MLKASASSDEVIMVQYKDLQNILLDMTQVGLCHTVIGISPESCCTASPSPLFTNCPAQTHPGLARAPVSAGSGAAGTAKQPHQSRENSYKTISSYSNCACGGRGRMAEEVQSLNAAARG